MGWFLKQSLMSPLYVSHHQRRIEWNLENLQTDFSKISSTNEARVTLSPDS